MLMSWDAVMDKDRAEPLIFTAFLKSLHRNLLEEKTGMKMEAMGPFAATTLIALMRDHPSWCDAAGKPDPDCSGALGRALDDGLALLVKRDGADMSQWRWGAEHEALLSTRSIAMSRSSTGSATSALRRAADFILSTAAAASKRLRTNPSRVRTAPAFAASTISRTRRSRAS